MIYKVTVKPEVARKIEVTAVEKGLTPEKFLAATVERIVQQHEALESEMPRMEERTRARQAKIDEGNRISSL